MRSSIIQCGSMALICAAMLAPTMLTPLSAANHGDSPPLVDVEYDNDASAVRVTASIDIRAAARTVHAVMVDCARALRVVAGLESCRITERAADGAWDVREHVISVNVLLPRVRNIFRSDYDRGRRIRFQRIGGDLKVSDGEWVLHPLTDGSATRVSYRARVALFIPIPGVLLREAVRYDIPNTLIALRRESQRGDAR